MTMIDPAAIIRHIAAYRPRPSVRFLDVLYGPRAKPLRTAVMAMILGRKVTGSDKMVQWNNFRDSLLTLVGITPRLPDSCTASDDSEFEKRANELLQS